MPPWRAFRRGCPDVLSFASWVFISRHSKPTRARARRGAYFPEPQQGAAMAPQALATRRGKPAATCARCPRGRHRAAGVWNTWRRVRRGRARHLAGARTALHSGARQMGARENAHVSAARRPNCRWARRAVCLARDAALDRPFEARRAFARARARVPVTPPRLRGARQPRTPVACVRARRRDPRARTPRVLPRRLCACFGCVRPGGLIRRLGSHK